MISRLIEVIEKINENYNIYTNTRTAFKGATQYKLDLFDDSMSVEIRIGNNSTVSLYLGKFDQHFNEIVSIENGLYHYSNMKNCVNNNQVLMDGQLYYTNPSTEELFQYQTIFSNFQMCCYNIIIELQKLMNLEFQIYISFYALKTPSLIIDPLTIINYDELMEFIEIKK